MLDLRRFTGHEMRLTEKLVEFNWAFLLLLALIASIGFAMLYSVAEGSFTPWAFRQAARLGMSEGMPQCQPVLLEPIMAVEVAVPSDATARINGIISQRRGQILGFDGREGWDGWDVVQAQIPAAEMEGLIVDLRSATSGVGTYTAKFDHLAELTGRLADQVLTAHGQAAA